MLQKNNLKNSIWSIIDVLLYPSLMLYYTPFFLQKMGEESYGIWMLANSFIVFLQIFNLGNGLNTQKKIAHSMGINDLPLATKHIEHGISKAILLALFSCILAIIIGTIQFYFNSFNTSQANALILFLLFSISGFLVGIKFIEQVFTNTLIAIDKIRANALYNIILRISFLFTTIVSVLYNIGLVYILLWVALIQILGLGFLISIIKNHFNQYSFKIGTKFSVLAQDFKSQKWMWLQSVCVIIAFQCDKFLVARWVGIQEFSYYAICSTIFNHIHLALMALTPWAMAQIAQKYARNGNYINSYLSVRSLIGVGAYLGSLILLLTYPSILGIWIGQKTTAQLGPLMKSFIAFELIFSFTIAPFYLLNAIDESKLQFKIASLYCALSLIGMYAGFIFGGNAISVINGSVISLIISLLFQQWVIAKKEKLHLITETIGLLLPATCLVIIIVIRPHGIMNNIVLWATSFVSFIYTFFYKYPFFKKLKEVNIEP